jgi:hypothetical protein
MTNTNQILDVKISYHANAWSDPSCQVSIIEVLTWLKNGKHKNDVSLLRTFLRNGEQDKYDAQKLKLPCVTFGGTFAPKRRIECMTHYNQLLVLDVDDLSSAELNNIKQLMFNDEHVISIWESPSQLGIKGLVQLEEKNDYSYPGDQIFHKAAFRSIAEYFLSKYQIVLDKSGNDLTRLCFCSYDPDIKLKDSFESFIVTDYSEKVSRKEAATEDTRKPAKQKSTVRSSKDRFFNPASRNEPKNRKTMKSIIRYLTHKNISITNDYVSWFRVAMAIASSFTLDIGMEYYLKLCRLDGPSHDENGSANLLLSCYENSKKQIHFQTLVYLAQNKGFHDDCGSEGGR